LSFRQLRIVETPMALLLDARVDAETKGERSEDARQ
jgi:hypothetical protein